MTKWWISTGDPRDWGEVQIHHSECESSKRKRPPITGDTLANFFESLNWLVKDNEQCLYCGLEIPEEYITQLKLLLNG